MKNKLTRFGTGAKLKLNTGIIILLTAWMCIWILPVFTQPDIIDRSFNPGDHGFGKGDGANKDVYAIEVQEDGRILIGGWFSMYNNTPKRALARLLPDGTIDKTFDVTFPTGSIIYDIYVLQDGKLMVAGEFTEVNGVPRRNIAKLLADGSLDLSFNPGSGANDWVRSIAVQPDGKIFLGGYFTTFNGMPAKSLVRLSPNGTVDPTFMTGSGFSGGIETMALLSDGRLLVGGGFSIYNGKEANRLVRLFDDGTVDESFFIGTGPESGGVWELLVQPDGKILVGGSFESFNGFNHGGITRLQSNGSVDSGFNPGIGADDLVLAILYIEDGSLWVGGEFTTFNGFQTRSIVKLRSNGARDMNVNLNGGADYRVFSLARSMDDKILVGGEFTYINLSPGTGLIQLLEDGTANPDFNPINGFDKEVNVIHVTDEGNILVGGDFRAYNGKLAKGIVRIRKDGQPDPAFYTGFGTESGGPTSITDIRSLAIQPDKKIIAAGAFTSFDRKNHRNIVRLQPDGSTDEGFLSGSGANETVNAVEIQPDGKILVAGFFTQFNGKAQGRITRLLPDGSIDNTFNVNGLGANSWITSMQLLADGKILIAGNFTTFNGETVNRMARLLPDGKIDNTFQAGTGFNNIVEVIKVVNDGKIVAGGWFTTFNGQSHKYLVRLNPDGQLDAMFNQGGIGPDFQVFAIAVDSDNNIIIGGSFWQYNGKPMPNLARLKPDGQLDETYGFASCNGNIFALDFDEEGHLFVGGGFTQLNEFGRNRIARLFARCIPSESFTRLTACDSLEWNGNIYSESGMYTFLTMNAGGCDSLATLELTVIRVDTTVTVEDKILTSIETDADSYQWLNCNDSISVIDGATDRIFIPTETGSYAVVLTKGECIDTSACYRVVITSVKDQQNQGIIISPTITGDFFTILSAAEITGRTWILADVQGRPMASGIIKNTLETIDIQTLPAGVYIFKITGVRAGKVIKL